MAIQFNCPYCTATIRVADEFAGKQGRCPKCDTRLMVPRVEIPQDGPTPQQSTSPESLADTEAGIRAVADQTSVGIHALEAAPGGVPEFLPLAPTTSVTSKLKRKARRNRRTRIWVVGVPVLCFLILIGFLAAMMMTSMPDLTGSLNATATASKTVPSEIYPWTSMNLPAEDRQQLQAAMESSPDAFTSELMTCRLLAAEKGIEVQLKASENNSWFVVDPSQSKALVLWAQKQQQHLAVARSKEMQTRVAEYCREKLLIQTGEHLMINAQAYRDPIGLNAHMKSLGYALEAFANNRVSRCAHEDDQGRLYFLLPTETRSFVIRGRTIADGTKPFPGEYNVTIIASEAAAEATTETVTEPANVDDDNMESGVPSNGTESEGMPSGAEKNEPAETLGNASQMSTESAPVMNPLQ